MIILFINLLYALISTYECDPAYFQILPKEGKISQNSSILMEGNLKSDFFKKIQSEKKVFLINKIDTIELKVSEFNQIDDYHQIFFKPTQILEENQTYFLYIKDEYNPFSDEGNYSTWSNQPDRWRTMIKTDTTPPKFLKQIKQVDKFSNRFSGGGYSYVVKFSVESTEMNRTLALVQLQEENKNIKELFIPIEDTTIVVSGNICLNKFNLISDKIYKVRFKLMDYSLNKSNEWSDWQEFKFDNPFPKIIDK